MNLVKSFILCVMLVCSTISYAQECYQTSIVSPTPFMGNNGEIFELADGSLWEVKYEYEYMYEYYPGVVICPTEGKLAIKGKSLDVEPVGGSPVTRLGGTPHQPQSDKCTIGSMDNPNINYSINPNVTYSLNPDVTYAINPDVTYSINPNVTYSYNPSVTYSINPDVETSLNPNYGAWTGYFVCSPDGKSIGASVIANEDVMVLFAGQKWTGYFVTNKRGGYNFFNNDNEWKGFLVPASTGGFVFFNRDKEWELSLVP